MVSVGLIQWVEATVTEPSFFKLCTEHTPIHLALLDEVVTCHALLHEKVGRPAHTAALHKPQMSLTWYYWIQNKRPTELAGGL